MFQRLEHAELSPLVERKKFMRFYLTTLTLAVAFLVAANVRADMQTLTFSLGWTDNGGSTNPNNESEIFEALVQGMSFTATQTETGVSFLFSSQENVTLKGPNGNSPESSFYFFSGEGVNSATYFTDVDTKNNCFLIWKPVDFTVYQSMNGTDPPPPYVWSFHLTFSDGYGWSDFLDLVNEQYFNVGMHVTEIYGKNITGGSGLRIYSDGLTGGFLGMDPPDDPSATPEPATLALMGLGLAGVGLAARRRMKK